MRISDWSSDVCSSDLLGFGPGPHVTPNSQDVTTTNYAAFGQATLAVTDRLNLTAGIRYTIEKKKGQSATFGDRDVSLFLGTPEQLGRASCRERVCQYV